MAEKKHDSEFGDGFLYPLSLFMCHADLISGTMKLYADMKEKHSGMFGADKGAQMWLCASADHMFGFDPEIAPSEETKILARSLKDRCMAWRLVMEGPGPKAKEVIQLINDAKELMFKLDEHYGNNPKEAQWS